MIVHNVTQGTTKWANLRAGKPTSSMFGSIVTPKTGKLSAQSVGYMHHLLAERMLGRPLDGPITFSMERGSGMEAEAVAAYEFLSGTATTEVGFITTDDGRYGASPDRLAGEDGLVEIKCPEPKTHVGYLLHEPASVRYRPQIQGQLLVTGRDWVDIMSYCPGMPEALVRVERDDKYLETLENALEAFCATLDDAWERLQSEYPAIVPEEEPFGVSRDDVA